MDNSHAADGFLDEIHDAIRALVASPNSVACEPI
jgi:hypothetical protein